jgi:hypothetical protein
VLTPSATAASCGPSPSCRSRPQPAALLGHPLDQRPAAVLQVGGEPQGVRHRGQLPGQLAEQPPVGRLELGLTGTGGHREHAERLAVPAQVDRVRHRAVRLAGPLHHLAAAGQQDPQLHGRQPQRVAHLPGHLLQGRSGRPAALQRGGDVGEQGVRVGPAAVQHPVDRRLHPAPGRGEQQGDGDGADEARHGALPAGQRSGPADHGAVDDGGAGDEDRPGQRPVDQRLDPVEPPAHHRHGDAERQRQAEQVEQPAAGQNAATTVTARP